MKNEEEILNELKGISPYLAAIKKTNVFFVPAGYFEIFAETVSMKVDANFSLLNKDVLKVPEGYFDNLSNQVLQKIKFTAVKTENIEKGNIENSPLLSFLQNKNVFTLPANYFLNLPQQVLQQIKPVAKVVKIKSQVWRIVAAAIFTGLIAVSSLSIFKTSVNHTSTESAVINSDIPTVASVNAQYKNEEQINEGISKLSDDEIIKFLETTGTSSDNEAISSNIEEKQLPSQQDYLLEEKTLDTYLQQINEQSSAN